MVDYWFQLLEGLKTRIEIIIPLYNYDCIFLFHRQLPYSFNNFEPTRTLSVVSNGGMSISAVRKRPRPKWRHLIIGSKCCINWLLKYFVSFLVQELFDLFNLAFSHSGSEICSFWVVLHQMWFIQIWSKLDLAGFAVKTSAAVNSGFASCGNT